MARHETPQGPTKKRVFLKVKVGEEYTEYVASYEGVQIEGLTMGGKEDIKDVVRRVIRAYNEPPDIVVRAAVSVVNHVMSAVRLGAKVVWGGVGVEFGDDERLKLSVYLYSYIDDETDQHGWEGEVVASFSGYDGIMVDSSHKVVKKVSYGREIDYMGLYRELIKVARYAYNFWPSY